MAHLQWYLDDIQTLVPETISNGLKQCLLSLTAPEDSPLPPFKLPVSSHASETLKGVVCRSGDSITATDIQLKLHSLKNKSFTVRINPKTNGYLLSQIDSCINHVSLALDQCDAIVNSRDPDYLNMAAQLLIEHINEAVASINSPVVLLEKPSEPAGGIPSNATSRCATPNPNISHSSQSIPVSLSGASHSTPWLFPNTPPADCFHPNLPPELIVEFYIAKCAIVVDVHVVDRGVSRAGTPSQDPSPSSSSANLTALTNLFKRAPVASNTAPKITYNGEQVSEVERVVVDTKDPILMSIEAKLSAIKSAAYRLHRNLAAVSGAEEAEPAIMPVKVVTSS
ncbi:hypothetical protein CJU89_2131 [Yarrowia sp. B02]|nr:hypothetical protein CJU89_2131 [Yarrowia sp. B02]